LKNAVTPDGGIFFATIGGKYSEGFDFKNELCRALVIIGVPYPSIGSPE